MVSLKQGIAFFLLFLSLCRSVIAESGFRYEATTGGLPLGTNFSTGTNGMIFVIEGSQAFEVSQQNGSNGPSYNDIQKKGYRDIVIDTNESVMQQMSNRAKLIRQQVNQQMPNATSAARHIAVMARISNYINQQVLQIDTWYNLETGITEPLFDNAMKVSEQNNKWTIKLMDLLSLRRADGKTGTGDCRIRNFLLGWLGNEARVPGIMIRWGYASTNGVAENHTFVTFEVTQAQPGGQTVKVVRLADAFYRHFNGKLDEFLQGNGKELGNGVGRWTDPRTGTRAGIAKIINLAQPYPKLIQIKFDSNFEEVKAVQSNNDPTPTSERTRMFGRVINRGSSQNKWAGIASPPASGDSPFSGIPISPSYVRPGQTAQVAALAGDTFSALPQFNNVFGRNLAVTAGALMVFGGLAQTYASALNQHFRLLKDAQDLNMNHFINEFNAAFLIWSRQERIKIYNNDPNFNIENRWSYYYNNDYFERKRGPDGQWLRDGNGHAIVDTIDVNAYTNTRQDEQKRKFLLSPLGVKLMTEFTPRYVVRLIPPQNTPWWAIFATFNLASTLEGIIDVNNGQVVSYPSISNNIEGFRTYILLPAFSQAQPPIGVNPNLGLCDSAKSAAVRALNEFKRDKALNPTELFNVRIAPSENFIEQVQQQQHFVDICKTWRKKQQAKLLILAEAVSNSCCSEPKLDYALSYDCDAVAGLMHVCNQSDRQIAFNSYEEIKQMIGGLTNIVDDNYLFYYLKSKYVFGIPLNATMTNDNLIAAKSRCVDFLRGHEWNLVRCGYISPMLTDKGIILRPEMLCRIPNQYLAP